MTAVPAPRAIEHDMNGLEQAVASVLAGEAGRICAPGQWLVRREADQVKVTIKVRVSNL